MNCSMPDFPVHHQLPELAQTHVYWVGDATQPSYPLSSPSPSAFKLSQNQGLFQWVSSSHQVAKVLRLTEDERVEGLALIFSCENSKITTHCWTTINRRMLDPPKKDTPHPRAKEKPQQDSRRGEIAFIIKPHTCQSCSEGSNKTLCAPGPRDPTETEPDLPLSVWVSSAEAWVSCGLLQGQGLCMQQTWVTQYMA